jgi:hypothetical protein
MHIYKKHTVNVVDKTLCDITGNLAGASLNLTFGYGSKNDGNKLNMDLDADTADSILNLLKEKFGEDKINKCLIDANV